MNTFNGKFIGPSKYWWAMMIVGIAVILCGFAYWFWPVAGYAIASQIAGWLLILAGFVQLCVASGPNRTAGWGWWIAGGVIDLFIGFMMARSVLLSEAVLPYFLAFIFVYWGIAAIVAAIGRHNNRYWWLQLINGILLLILGYFFVEAGWVQNMETISFLASLAFIYWGFTLAMTAYDLRPTKSKE